MDHNIAATSLDGTLSFCRMAIRSGALFNGGALIALIPVTSNVYFETIKNPMLVEAAQINILDSLIFSATLFITGLILTGLSSILAFFGEFQYTNFHLTTNQNKRTVARRILFVGGVLIIGSLACFATGAFVAANAFRIPNL